MTGRRPESRIATLPSVDADRADTDRHAGPDPAPDTAAARIGLMVSIVQDVARSPRPDLSATGIRA